MASKRKREEDLAGDSVVRPAVGTRTFATGQAVKDGLGSGSRQAIVSFHQQLHTYPSKLPLPISHPTVTILQHYLDLSPTCDEILGSWKEGDRTRNDRLVESSVSLLGLIVTVLRPLPFFRTTLVNLVNKVLTPSEPFSDSINRSLQSERRDLIQATLSFVAGVVNLDPPPISHSHGSGGKLATRMWSVLSDGGSVKGIGKMFSMRIRNQEGKPLYGAHDPNDRADIRHLALQVVLPLLALPNVYSYARTLMPPIYSQLDQDPPITIFRVLSAIWDVVTLSSPGTSRRISLALINETSIDLLFKLMPRQDYEPTSGQKVGEVVKSFIEGVTTTPGRGLCFIDDGWYPRQIEDKGKDEDEVRGNREDREKQKLHNRVLANVIRKLGARVIDDDGRLGDLVTKIVRACPELVAGYWAHSALAVDPKLDVRWMATMTFIGRIISLPPPTRATFRLPAPRGSDTIMPYKAEPPAISTIIESILPSPMHKNHLTRGLQHSDALVRHMTAVTLARGLQKLQVVQILLREIESEIAAEGDSSKEGPWSRARRELEFEARRRVPEVLVVITFAQQSAQLAPAEPETDEDKALAAKSTMLTESALRLFGLYYRTLPSLSHEAKFDVGRLLVSSTSAKAEKRERKLMQSGSVADDAGSLASFGTAGTAGMGGGFGYARGEVQGFDALSQIHVLALLRDVKEWDWARKAAASQYTYLYHILQLHLNAQSPYTRDLSSSLIDNMLRPTLLFEHDPSEIRIWLSALPHAHASVSGPLLTVQQIHILSFLDDCFRRAQQLPYRYIEQLTTLVPDYFPWSHPDRQVSSVLMAILEQFNAKVLGQHMSTDAAVVVLGYLRRVMLALMGKMDDSRFIEAILGKLDDTIAAGKAKGHERPGLETLISALKHDVQAVFGGKGSETFTEALDFPRLVDEEQWRNGSLESLLLHGSSPDLKETIKAIAEHSSPAEATRHARFLVHLLSQHPTTTPIILDALHICLSRSSSESKAFDEVKALVFQAACIKDLFLTEKGDQYRQYLSNMVTHLDVSIAGDTALVEPYSSRLLHRLKKPKKYDPLQTLSLLHPWTGLLDVDAAGVAVAHLAKASSKLHLTTQNQNTISGIFKAAQNPSIPLEHLSTFLALKVYKPYTDLLGQPNIFERTFTVDIDEAALARLLGDTEPEAVALVQKLVETCPSVARLFASALETQPDLLEKQALLPAVAQLLDLPDAVEAAKGKDRLLLNAFSALRSESADVSGAARAILARSTDTEGVTRLLREIDLKIFSQSHAQLALDLASLGKSDHLPAIKHILSIALQLVARACSDEGDLEMTSLELVMLILSILQANPPHLDIPVELVEPVITNVINDRLDVDLAVDLATQLAGCVSLKASFVRQHLQALLSSGKLVELSETTSMSDQRLPFVKLYSALFAASTYVSCQPNFVEPLLSLYRGTMSEADRVVLDMFQTFESVRRVSIASVLRSWSSSGLTGTDRAFDAFTSLDGGKVNNTCASFPLSRKAGTAQIVIDTASNERVYDPVFVLALFGAMLVEKDLTGLEWVEVMRCGGLGIIICCLSSRDEHMRRHANWLLSKTFEIISNTPFHERDQLLYTLRLVRHSIVSPDKSASFPRVPPLLALFLSYVVRAQATPSHFLYPITSRFLLQRPVLDLSDVPMLYSMLYASEDGWKNERAWIVRLLRDGVKSETDWRIAKRRHTWSLLATLFQSSLDIPFRRLVLQALASFVKVPLAVRSLVNRDCVLSWLSMQWHDTITSPNKAADEEQASILRIYETIVKQLVEAEMDKRESEDKKPNGDADVEAMAVDGNGEAHVSVFVAEGDRDRPNWVLDMDVFVQSAAEGADSARLETLSRMLKTVAPIYLPAEAFLAVTSRMADLPSSTRVAETLFEAGLSLTPDSVDLQDRLDELQNAVTSLKRIVTASNGDLGRAVRRETRAFVFAQAQQ